MRKRGQGHYLTFDPGSQSIRVTNMSKATWPIVTRFHIEPPWAEGSKVCSNNPGYITNMAIMSIRGKNLYNSSSVEPVD